MTQMKRKVAINQWISTDFQKGGPQDFCVNLGQVRDIFKAKILTFPSFV